MMTGMNELIASLHSASQDVRDDGMRIVREEVEAAAEEIRRSYPATGGTGKLRARVKTEYPSSTLLVGVVKSAAPHSHIYEFGTKLRQTASGANRGVMPSREITPKIAQRHRSRMYERLIQMVRAIGFEVTT